MLPGNYMASAIPGFVVQSFSFSFKNTGIELENIKQSSSLEFLIHIRYKNLSAGVRKTE